MKSFYMLQIRGHFLKCSSAYVLPCTWTLYQIRQQALVREKKIIYNMDIKMDSMCAVDGTHSIYNVFPHSTQLYFSRIKTEGKALLSIADNHHLCTTYGCTVSFSVLVHLAITYQINLKVQNICQLTKTNGNNTKRSVQFVLFFARN